MAASDDGTYKLVKQYEFWCDRNAASFYEVAECLRAPKSVYLGKVIVRFERRTDAVTRATKTRRTATAVRGKRTTRKQK